MHFSLSSSYRQASDREDIGDGQIVLGPLQAIPMAEDFIVSPKLEQVGNHTLAGVDIATVDDVASTCRGKGPVRAEEGPLGPIDESLEAREIEEVRAIEILSGTALSLGDRRVPPLIS